MRSGYLNKILLAAIVCTSQHAIAGIESERFISPSGDLEWHPKGELKLDKKGNNAEKRVYVTKNASKLITPLACKYLPIEGRKIAGKLFYVESNQYNESDLYLLKNTCKSGLRSEKIISQLPTINSMTTDKLIHEWVKSYNKKNKYYVKDTGWKALSNDDGSFNVSRSIELFNEDPDLISVNKEQDDIFLNLYKPNPLEDKAIGIVNFEWNLNEKGQAIPISDYAKEISHYNEDTVFGNL